MAISFAGSIPPACGASKDVKYATLKLLGCESFNQTAVESVAVIRETALTLRGGRELCKAASHWDQRGYVYREG